MKKITFLFAILLGVSFSSVTQQNLNLRFGYKIPTETFGKSNYPNVHGFEIGLSKDFKISEKFSFRPGLSYYFQWRTEKLGENYFLWETLYPEINVQKNSRIRNCFHFLEIPFMAAWKIGKFDLEGNMIWLLRILIRHFLFLLMMRDLKTINVLLRIK